ncbi:hypothetical protein [Kaistia granuli]|uniref:hypothetical protein n=1 Tax=Kaistia granuli TaxID=363259 RepID=UPI00036F0591|nr:hypothetical protein [Kaistia granuli]
MGKSTKSKVVPLHPEADVPAPVSDRPPPGQRIQKAISQAAARQIDRTQPVRVDMKIQADGTPLMCCPHDDPTGFTVHLKETFGSSSFDFAWRQVGLVRTAVNATDRDEMNAALAFVGGLKPADEIEAALAVQMVGVHEASVRLLATAMKASTIDAQERYINMATKMQRTFTAQVEAMKRYRSSGEQTIRVQHQNVTVQEGGQAVIGDVHGGGRRG